MIGTVLTLKLMPIESHKTDIIISILKMKKLKYREVLFIQLLG